MLVACLLFSIGCMNVTQCWFPDYYSMGGCLIVNVGCLTVTRCWLPGCNSMLVFTRTE